MRHDRGPRREERPAPARAPALLAVLVLVTSLALAGCVGSDSGSSPTETPGEDGGDQADDADDSGGSDDGSDGTDTGDDGSDGDDQDGNASSDPEARTPTGAMPDQEPAETGEGYAKFEISGQASLAVDTQVAFSHLADSDDYAIVLADDITLIEVVLTWESEHADLDCMIEWTGSGANRCTNHGMDTQEQIDDTAVWFQSVNGSQWEHLAMTPDQVDADDEDFPLDGTLRIDEDEVWEPTAAPHEASGSLDGLSYTVEVWIHTVPAEPSHHPMS